MRRRTVRSIMAGALLAGLLSPIGCKPDNPLADVLNQLTKAAAAGDKAALENLIDAEIGHKLLTARLVLLLPKDKQNDAFKAAEAEMAKGPATYNATRSGVVERILKQKDLLASGCKLTNPKPEDQQAAQFPALPENAQEYMSKELGTFVHGLKASVSNSVAARAACADGREFVFYAVQKRKEGNETPPWKLLGVSEGAKTAAPAP